MLYVCMYFKVILNILMPETTWNCFTVEVPGSGAFYVTKSEELFYKFI